MKIAGSKNNNKLKFFHKYVFNKSLNFRDKFQDFCNFSSSITKLNLINLRLIKQTGREFKLFSII